MTQMTLPNVQGYAILGEAINMTIAEMIRLAQNGAVFLGIAGKGYEAKEVGE